MPAAKKSKAKKSKAADQALDQAVEVREYTVAKCQWCGMQWKHYGDETPEHFCGKVCASHEVIEPEAAPSDG